MERTVERIQTIEELYCSEDQSSQKFKANFNRTVREGLMKKNGSQRAKEKSVSNLEARKQDSSDQTTSLDHLAMIGTLREHKKSTRRAKV